MKQGLSVIYRLVGGVEGDKPAAKKCNSRLRLVQGEGSPCTPSRDLAPVAVLKPLTMTKIH